MICLTHLQNFSDAKSCKNRIYPIMSDYISRNNGKIISNKNINNYFKAKIENPNDSKLQVLNFVLQVDSTVVPLYRMF